MKSVADVGLRNVQAVYSGPEGDLWELIMGQQVHIGASSRPWTSLKKRASGRG